MTVERFDAYVERCLYEPDAGFYARHGQAGDRAGDFVTSPEVGPLFGAVIAGALDSWWTDLGRPDGFTVVEAGAGRGALAASILAAAPDCLTTGRYVTVERSARLRTAQEQLLGDRITRCGDIAEVGDGLVGVVLANELLDNLPFRLVVREEAGWAEVFVVDDHPELGDLDPTGIPLPDVPVGRRLPLSEAAASWVGEALDRLTGGRVVAVDYGVPTTAELLGRDWLRTYRDHQRGADPFEAPGRCDITCDVPFDQLPPPVSLRTQAEALRAWGIERLVDEGRRIWSERAHLGDLAAMAARSRITEAEALLDPQGLGGFLVAEWTVPGGG